MHSKYVFSYRKVFNKKEKNKIIDKTYTVENLVEALNSATLKIKSKDIIEFNKTNHIYSEIEKIFNIENDFEYFKKERFIKWKKQFVHDIKKAVFP